MTMIDILLLLATFLSAVVMSLTLAHALELPGKMRLNRDQYYTVQTIFYPGFTLGGAAEPLAILATAAVLLFEPVPGRTWLVATALVALIAVQLLFWLIVQPVNRQWVGLLNLSGAAKRFFDTGQTAVPDRDWMKLRDQWERGHLLRAVAAIAAFVLLLIALGSKP